MDETSNLSWIPHLTEVWALARLHLDGDFHLECIFDRCSKENVGDPIDIRQDLLQNIIYQLSDVSDVFEQACTKGNFDVITPVTDSNVLEGIDDVCDLVDVNEASLLHCIRARYAKKQIYTNIGRLLIVLNPFTSVKGLYDPSVVTKYTNADDPYQLQPHVYQISAGVVKGLRNNRRPKSILITGESGSGKTECTKQILKYLALTSRESQIFSRSLSLKKKGSSPRSLGSRRSVTNKHATTENIEDRILKVTPLLEAFGNATTSRNYNSSRFGKWTEVIYDSNMSIAGARITSYLLELPRVVQHASKEKTYHVFYLLIGAMKEELASRVLDYQLTTDASNYNYLRETFSETNSQCERKSPDLLKNEDMVNFHQLKLSFSCLHFTANEQDSIFAILAAILHLGNIEYELNDEPSAADTVKISLKSLSHLDAAQSLLKVKSELFHQTLIQREVVTGAREILRIPLKLSEAYATRDGFCKLLYELLFEWIIYRSNLCLEPSCALKENLFIGILDIAGFESFAQNSFEQFCINTSNEKLQNQFNKTIFQEELNLYRKEGLGDIEFEYNDNSTIIDLIEGKMGIMRALDEEIRIPQGNDRSFYSKVRGINAKSTLISFPKITQKMEFTVRHYAGFVTYSVTGWLKKNSHAVQSLVEQALKTSTNLVVESLMKSTAVNVLNKIHSSRDTVGSVFRRQLQSLMTKISSTDVFYIRCIKPNAELAPFQLSTASVLHQLKCSGVLQTVDIRKNGKDAAASIQMCRTSGFPFRMLFTEFISKFDILLYPQLLRQEMSPRDTAMSLVSQICQIYSLDLEHFAIGYTLVFIKAATFAYLDYYRIMIVSSSVIKIQASWKGYLTRKYTKIAIPLVQNFNKVLYMQQRAIIEQNGQYLYPTSIIEGVETAEELKLYVANNMYWLDQYLELPEIYQKPIILKTKSALDEMQREANIIDIAQHLYEADSKNFDRLSSLLSKATTFAFLHYYIDWAQGRYEQLIIEMSLSSKGKEALNSQFSMQCRNVQKEIMNYLEKYELDVQNILTDDLKTIFQRLTMYSNEKNETPETEAEYNDLSFQSSEKPIVSTNYANENAPHDLNALPDSRNFPANYSRKMSSSKRHKLTFSDSSLDHNDLCESYTSSDVSYESDSDESVLLHEDDMRTSRRISYSNPVRRTVESRKKFVTELKTAMRTCDVDSISLVLERIESHENVLDVAEKRLINAANQLLHNLNEKKWLLSEIQSAVVAIVWGNNDIMDVAENLKIDDLKIDAARKALTSVRTAGKIDLAMGSTDINNAVKEKRRLVITRGVLNFRDYQGLAFHKKQNTFLGRLFGGGPNAIDCVCSHTKGKLPSPMTELPTKEFKKSALQIFLLIQGLMGEGRAPLKSSWFDILVSTGIHYVELRDEMYLQLMKQLTKNPNKTAEAKGWGIMLSFCQNFLPSKALFPYVRYFIHQKATSCAQEESGLAFDEIGEIVQQTMQSFTDLAAKENTEENSNNNFETKVSIRLMDNTKRIIKVTAETTLSDIVNELCDKFNMDSNGWAVMIMTEIMGKYADLAATLLHILNFDLLSIRIAQATLLNYIDLPQFQVVPDSCCIWNFWDTNKESFPTFVFRRRCISKSETIYPHPSFAYLTYKQLLWELRHYPFACSLEQLGSIIAHILVAEKWKPPSVAIDMISAQGTAYRDEIGIAALQSVAITHKLITNFGFIPLVYLTPIEEIQNEIVANVQNEYRCLDTEEHQSLAIASVLHEMQALQHFGSLFWLTVEPPPSVSTVLLSGSQLRAAYENLSVRTEPCQLQKLLEEISQKNSEIDPLQQNIFFQPVIVTRRDLYDYKEQLKKEFIAQQKFQEKTIKHSKVPRLMQKFFQKFSSSQATVMYDLMFGEVSDEAGLSFSGGLSDQSYLLHPLWMTLSQEGLSFTPALLFQDDRSCVPQQVTISPQQIFACEILWFYSAKNKTWLYGGLLLCVNLEEVSLPPQWRLIPIVPLSASVPAIIAAMQAFFPSILFYGTEQSDEDSALEKVSSTHERESSFT